MKKKNLNIKSWGPFVPGLKIQAQNSNEQTILNYHTDTKI